LQKRRPTKSKPPTNKGFNSALEDLDSTLLDLDSTLESFDLVKGFESKQTPEMKKDTIDTMVDLISNDMVNLRIDPKKALIYINNSNSLNNFDSRQKIFIKNNASEILKYKDLIDLRIKLIKKSKT
jgi:hypothetical protein